MSCMRQITHYKEHSLQSLESNVGFPHLYDLRSAPQKVHIIARQVRE
eukprot:Gb_01571 [translate_table: standard]